MRRGSDKRPQRNASLMPMLVVIALAAIWLMVSYGTDGRSIDLNKASVSSINQNTDQLIVHILDIGQADSILIQWPKDHAMLIDGGNKADGSFIVKYLEQAGVEQIDYLIATHPHEDHIGGLPYIIQKIPVRKIYMPKVTNNTKIYEDLLGAIKSKNLTINAAKAGVILPLGEDIKAEFLAPMSGKYDDLNDYSAVLKLQYGQTKFLFMGDAGILSEKEMLNSGEDLKADVIKIGHHGSSSATSDEFLDAVQPRAAVISVGRNNDYGHPAQSTLDKLIKRNIAVFRTDEDGIVTFVSDGKDIKVGTTRNSEK